MSNFLLNKEEILKLEPGNELDILVAKKIMGLNPGGHLEPLWEEGSTPDGKDGWDGFFCPRCGCPADLYGKRLCCLRYSTDMSAAWEVIVKMENDDYWWEAENVVPNSDPVAYYWSFFKNGINKNNNSCWEILLPSAICKAALLAVLENDND
jgi:hypothetical protein